MPVGIGVHCRRVGRGVFMCVILGVAMIGVARPVHGQGVVKRPPLAGDWPVYAPTAGEERREAAALQNPSGEIALRDAIALALLQNPGLAAFAWENRAREARILQAGRRPNPLLGVTVEDLGAGELAGGGINEPVQSQATIQLSQLIELGGKRTARHDLATAERDLANWDYEAARIDLLTEVTRAFTEVLAAQETVRLSDETTKLVDQVRASVSARVTAGDVSPIEETRANVALASVQVEAARARRALEASRTKLALLWGSSTAAFMTATGDLRADPAPLPTMSSLTERLAQTPELARWASELVRRQAALAAERAKGVPDISVSAGYRRFTTVDANALIVGVSVPLPLFDRNRNGIEEARSRVAKVHEERRAAEARVNAALADAYAALAGAHDEVVTLRATMLPGSQEAFNAVTEGYRLGRFGFQDVLESQRTLIAAGSQYLRALADYRKAIASVERLIGAAIGGTDGPTASPRE
jgi:outer membrane protein, heavy metal efflux system